MFRKLTLGTMLALSFVLPAHAQSTNWVNIANSKDGKSFDIDLSSVERFDSIVGYRTRIRLSRPDSNGTVLSAYQQITDCDSGTSQTVGIVSLNRQNRIIFNEQYDNAPIEQIKRGTLGHKVYSFLCQAQNNSDIDFQRDLLRAYTVDIPNSVTEQVKAVMNSRF
ncbi:hypothetical protein [Tolypothrix sp. VBCCA 56010]|uniref:hypothetical protein n=1 Tax=Tolypothrix sp. VBCCA 56010 TaxID=3137731 RepID=UPI003D7DC89C